MHQPFSTTDDDVEGADDDDEDGKGLCGTIMFHWFDIVVLYPSVCFLYSLLTICFLLPTHSTSLHICNSELKRMKMMMVRGCSSTYSVSGTLDCPLTHCLNKFDLNFSYFCDDLCFAEGQDISLGDQEESDPDEDSEDEVQQPEESDDDDDGTLMQEIDCLSLVSF